MRILFIFILTLFSFYSIAQSPVKRSSAAVTAEDARLKALLNFAIPTAQDTTLNGGLDSLGSFIFRRTDNSVYVRVRASGSTNKWIKLVTLNDTTQAIAFRGTVAELREVNTAVYNIAVTTDYGTGTWYRDVSDNSSADNTGTVIVDAAGSRWKRAFNGKTFQVQWFTNVNNITTTFSSIVAAAPTGSTIIFESNRYYTTDSILRITKPLTIDGNSANVRPTTNIFSVFNIQSDSVSISKFSIDLNFLGHNGIRWDGYDYINIDKIGGWKQYKKAAGLAGLIYGLNTHHVSITNIYGYDIINSDTTVSSHSPLIKIVTGGDITIKTTSSDSVGLVINLVDVKGADVSDIKAWRTKDNIFYIQGSQTEGINISGFYANGFEEGLVFNTGTWDKNAGVGLSNGSFIFGSNRGVTLRKGRGVSIENVKFISCNTAIAQSNSFDGVHDISVNNIQINQSTGSLPIYFNKDTAINISNAILTQPLGASTSAYSFVNSSGVIATNLYAKDTLGNLRYGIVLNNMKNGTFDNSIILDAWGGKFNELSSSNYVIRNEGSEKADSLTFTASTNGGFKVNSQSGPVLVNGQYSGQFSVGKNLNNRMEYWSPMIGTSNANMLRLGNNNKASSGRTNMLEIYFKNEASGTNSVRGIHVAIDTINATYGTGPTDYLLAEAVSDSTNTPAARRTDARIGFNGIATFRTSLYVGANTLHPSAALQAHSVTKGFLPPVMTNTQMLAISAPAAGLMVYNSTFNAYYIFNNTSWVPLSSSIDTTSLSNRINAKLDTSQKFNAIAGANMTLTGTYPNITFNSSGGGGSSTGDTLSTTDQMIAYSGPAYTMLVKDSMRGGIFYYTTAASAPDSGIVFPATGKGSGYWIRRYDQKTWRLSWFGIIGDGVTDYSSRIRYVCSLIRARGGVHLIIPEGTYIVSRGLSGGVQQMFLLGSNTWIEGEGIDKTILKLNPLDNFNFRRMFAVVQTDTVENIEISNLTVDMSNTYTTYPPPPEFGADAQNAAVFLYSQDYVVRNVFVHDIKTINITGDCVVASRNAENVEFNRIYMRDYLRTGGGVGGDAGGENLKFISLVNLPNYTVVLGTGGEGFHSEPFNHLVRNVTLRDCYLDAFTGSGISNLVVDNVTTFTSKTCQINNSNGVRVINSHIPLAELKISPYGDGNIIIANNDSLRSLRISYVSEANPNPPGAIQVHHNNILTSNETAVEINSISNVEIHHNYIVTDTGRGIYLVNNLSEKVHNNTIVVNGGGTYSGVYTLMTAGAFGAGMSSYANNVIKSPYRGIWGISKSIKLGINFIDAPTKVTLTGDISKIFPVVDGGGKQILTAQSTTFPNYGTYSLGDIIEPKTTTRGQPLQYVCTTAGSLYRGAWASDTVYYVNEYVRDTGSGGSTNYIYVSIAPGGQAEDPSNDTDNTYWRLASTTVAAFTQANVLGMLFSGSGSPEGVVTAGVGAIYLNMTATSTADLLFGKITGASNTGWDTLNTGGGGGTYIQSLNGQTQATQTFGTPTVTTVGPSVTSSAGVHTINIPVAKMINDSLTAQPLVNMYIQNLGKSVGDTLLRVAGDTLKAKSPVDGTNIEIVPTDTTIIINAKYTKGLYSTNGNSVLTTFTITHSLGTTPTNVIVTPGHVNSALLLYVNNFTSTTFDVVFTTAPTTGTNNVVLNWQAFR